MLSGRKPCRICAESVVGAARLRLPGFVRRVRCVDVHPLPGVFQELTLIRVSVFFSLRKRGNPSGKYRLFAL